MSHEHPDDTIILDDEKASLIADHDYDGIHELSRSMPIWLSLIFFCTATFGILYMLHFLTGSGPSQELELAAKMTDIERQQKNAQSNESLKAAVATTANAPDPLVLGKTVFEGKCAVCHGHNAEGTIGPNLTDNYWLHGQGRSEDITMVIKTGVLDKGMPAWQTTLTPEELAAVSAFVHSLAGQEVKNGKAPQGQLVKSGG